MSGAIQASVVQGSSSHAELTQQDVLDFSNDDYYWQKWQASLEGRSKWAGFNWAATIFSMPWCMYRRMYWLGLLVFLSEWFFLIVLYVALIIIFPTLEESGGEIAAFVATIAIFRIGFGVLANRIYLRRALKAAATLGHAVGDERSASLKAAGGTNEKAMWFSYGLIVLTNVLMKIA